MPPRTLGWTLLTVVVTACGGADRADSSPIVRDSAGIRIVENADRTGEEGDASTLSTEPLVDIGVVEGAAEYQLFGVYGATRLSDGRIVVANGGTGELRFFDPKGKFLFASGRKGEGPGEFEDLQAVWSTEGDSLIAYDFGLQRLSVFDSTGAFVRLIQPEAPGGRPPFVMGIFGDGSLLIMGAPIYDAPGGTTGIIRNSLHFLHYTAEGALADTVGRFPWGAAYRVAQEGDYRVTSLPFARYSSAAAGQDHLFFGAAETYEIAVYTLDGVLERLIRWDRPNRPVSGEDIRLFKEERLERAREEGSSAAMKRMLAELPFPETKPAYRTLKLDTRGYLWAQDYPAPGEGHTRWTIFDVAGRLAGTIEMPERFEAFEIGADYVLGRWTDELGVEHVRLYGLKMSRDQQGGTSESAGLTVPACRGAVGAASGFNCA